MIDVIAYSFAMGFFLGFVIFKYRGEDLTELRSKMKSDQATYNKELQYYKKLTKTLVDENIEFRKNIK
jgi:hypothetical protein